MITYAEKRFPNSSNGLAIKGLNDIEYFCREASGLELRDYQKAPAYAILKSIQQHAGRSVS